MGEKGGAICWSMQGVNKTRPPKNKFTFVPMGLLWREKNANSQCDPEKPFSSKWL